MFKIKRYNVSPFPSKAGGEQLKHQTKQLQCNDSHLLYEKAKAHKIKKIFDRKGVDFNP